jgi:putative ABC transport system permease protein
MAAGLLAGARAASVSPIEALRRSEGPTTWRPSALVVGPLLLIALVGALLAFVNFDSRHDRLTASAIGALLLALAAMLLTPLVVPWLGRAVGWPLERGGRILGHLARENTTRTPVRTAVTASSLMIGLALVLFVAVYVGGVKTSTRQAIDRTFTADYAIVNRDGSSSIPAASTRSVAGVPGVAAVSAVKRATTDLVGTGQINAAAIDPASIEQVYRFNWDGGQQTAMADLQPGDVLLERDTARAAHARVGQQVQVVSPSGLRANLTVRGIYVDRTVLPGMALPQTQFDQLFNQGQPQQVFVKLAPDTDRASTLGQIQSALSDLPGVVVRSEQELKDQAGARAGHVLALFYALLALTGVLALLGLATATALAIHERTRELGVLRALGMTRAQARQLIRDESVITAGIGTIVGAILGLLIAWLVTRALTAQGIVFSIPWVQLVLVIVVGLAVGVLAALPAAARAARLDVLSAIAQE